MDACYVPNNPQYGLSQLEYGSCQGGYPQQEEAQPGHGNLCCGGLLHDCHLLQCQDLAQPVQGAELEDFAGHYDCDVQALRHCSGLEGSQEGGDGVGDCPGQEDQDQDQGGCWGSDDMGSFSLPPLDLDPLPSLFPFSPCPTGYKGELKEKQPHEVADVLLSLKHAVVHPGAELAPSYSQQDMSLHPQMMMGGPGCYEPCGPSVFPTMSLNVSMNMTMHGYPPDQMCPQMQWGQNPPASPMNMMYTPNQGMLSPTPYPGSATYSFTADFRTPNQSDPLITATSSFKPIQIPPQKTVVAQNGQNYSNLFCQKPSAQPGFGQKQNAQIYPGQNSGPMRTRSSSSSSKIQVQQEMTPTYQILGGQNQGHHHSLEFQQHVIGNGMASVGIASPMAGGGKVQIGSLSGCSESEDEQKPNLCRICGKTYARPSTLKTHLRTHSGERPYRCVDCNKSFSQAANLTAHVRTHTGQKPFRCPICDRRFSQSSSVTTHMRTHSGERPYRCRACKKAFSDSSTLTKHLRIHSGEKPYQCKLCLLRFSQSGNLNRHMRVHGNNGALLG